MKKPISLFLALAVCSWALASGKKKVATAVKKTNVAANNSATQKQSNFIYSGPVEIQAYNAIPAKPAPVGNEFFEYVGRNLNEPNVQSMIVSLPGDYDVSNMDGNIFYIWRSSGVALKFDNKNKLQQIRFMNGKEYMGSFCNSFTSQLPKNLSFTMKRADIEQMLGKPVDVSNPAGDERFFATYSTDYNNFNVVITYNTSSNQEMSAGVEDILIMKPATNLSNQPTTVLADASVKSQPTDVGVSNGVTEPNKILPISYIGKDHNDPEVKNYIDNMNTSSEVVKYENSSQLLNKDAGMVMNFDNNDKVASVVFLNSKVFLGQSFKQYQGVLPASLSFEMTREQVEKQFGAPVQTSTPDQQNDFWAMYVINGGSDAAYITYNTKSADYKTATIGDIRIEKLK